jgi:hypothetical protein
MLFPAGSVSREAMLATGLSLVPAGPASAFGPADAISGLLSFGFASGMVLGDPEGVGTPVSRVGNGPAEWSWMGAGPASRVIAVESVTLEVGVAVVSRLGSVELIDGTGRSVSNPALEVVGLVFVGAISAPTLDGETLTAASLTGSTCVEVT